MKQLSLFLCVIVVLFQSAVEGVAFQTRATKTLTPRPVSELPVPPPVPESQSAQIPSGVTVQPPQLLDVIRLPEESPHSLDVLTIDAEQMPLSHPDGSVFVRRKDLIPEPFCSKDVPSTIGDATTSERARCCDKAAETASKNVAEQTQSETPLDSGETSGALTAVFSGAAHFVTGNCENEFECSAQPPIVIYEGMTVRMQDNGCYEVRGIVEGPRVPAILRLQLAFTVQGQPLARVTLPPIRLTPDANATQGLPYETQSWFIRRTGYSDILKDWQTLKHDGLVVSRSGVATYGDVPQL